MNILIASDSYKGSLSSLQVAEKIKEGIHRVYPDAAVQCIAVADGGEGTVEAVISSLGGKRCTAEVTGPDGKKILAYYGILNEQKAVIEMAAASGLPLVEKEKRNVMEATTYGTGELMKAAILQGCRKIYVGVGGSATNDGGVGMAQALGISFLDCDGKEIGFGGGELERIVKIDMSAKEKWLDEADITVMNDVTNPLCGPYGASAVYGPQKGASQEQVQRLDRGLQHLADLVRREIGIDMSEMPGAGAAGGLGGGLAAFAGAKLQSGIDTVLEMADFEQKLQWADLVITGEGMIDSQSAYGKVISGIAQKAKLCGVPVAAIAGGISESPEEVYKIGISSMEPVVCRPMDLEEAMGEGAGARTADAAERLMRTIKLAYQLKSI